MKHVLAISLLLITLYGCSGPKGPSDGQPDPAAIEPLFDGTVGSLCELTGYSAVRVQGYSLVLNLPQTGSAESPVPIRDYLLGYLRKLKSQKRLPARYQNLGAAQIISDLSTAVVLVQGLVPPGAPCGKHFDVDISTIEETQTTSLQGGFLMPTELRLVVAGRGGQPLAGRPTASAQGPIFINPFPVSPRSERRLDPRRGIVLGGGASLYDREIRLALLRPDFRIAQQIQNRINARFKTAGDDWVARARREIVQIQVPQRYRENYDHFVNLIWALYLRSTPGHLEMKLRELNERIAQPGADYEAIALAWEAVGKSALPFIEEWYRHPERGEPAYYAARTAITLDDNKAVDALTTIALDNNHPCQLRAADTLGQVSRDPQVRMTLHRLLAHENFRLRLLAYEGLRRINDPAIRSIAARDFRLDTVTAPGAPIIAVWATVEPRIVLFGQDLSLPRDIFFSTPDESIILNARPDDESLAVTRKLPGSGRLVKGSCPRNLTELVKLLATPGPSAADPIRPMSFSQIVGLLHDLTAQGIITAHFQIHRVPGDLTG